MHLGAVMSCAGPDVILTLLHSSARLVKLTCKSVGYTCPHAASGLNGCLNTFSQVTYLWGHADDWPHYVAVARKDLGGAAGRIS
jgi:hypothetical protein